VKNIMAVVIALLVSACATTPDQAAESRVEKEYRTGSNIPMRDRTARSDAKDVDPALLEDVVRRGYTPPVGKMH
jgi:hypothetical protein